jgi:hypothetical protein
VAADDHSYLTDFGLTAFLDSSSTASGTGHWVGTPDFAAPEQIRGERPDARTDVYALGCVLFFLLTARAPFVREGHEAKLWAHLTEPPPHLGIGSPAIDAVITRAMAKRADERFASAGDLARAALAAAAGEAAAPEGGSVAVGSAAATEPASRSLTLEAPTIAQPPERRSRRPAAIALAAALLAAGAAAILVLPNGNTPPPRPTASATATPGPTPKPAQTVTLRRVAGVPAGVRPTSLAVVHGRVWVGERGHTRLRMFDPRTARPLHVTALASGPSQLAATAHGVWAALWRAQVIARIDARTGRVAGHPVSVPGRPSLLTVGGDSLYVGLSRTSAGAPGTLMRINRTTGAVVWSRVLPGIADRLAWLDGTLYALLSAPNRILAIDPATSVTRITFTLPGVDAIDLAAANGRLWATVRGPDWLIRLDPRTGRRGVAYVGRSPSGVSAHGKDIWVSLWAASRVVLVDAHTLRRRAGIDVALNPFTIRSDAAGAWVVSAGAGRLLRLKKL